MGTTIWSGLMLGSVYALVATGFNLSLLPSGVLNFAQGALAVACTYLTYFWLHSLGIPAVAALGLNVLAGIALGLVCELTTVRPLRRLGGAEGSHAELITTVGMATAIIGVIGLIWGYDPLRVPFNGPDAPLSFLGIQAYPVEVLLVGSAVVICTGLALWVRYSRLGQVCRAVAEDREAATLRGINVSLLSLAGFAAAGGLAGLTAMAVGPVTFAVPELAHTLALGGFVAIALGGERSFIGALGGGLTVGVVSAFASRYIGVDYGNLAVLAVLLITLSVRPKGLGGEREARFV